MKYVGQTSLALAVLFAAGVGSNSASAQGDVQRLPAGVKEVQDQTKKKAQDVTDEAKKKAKEVEEKVDVENPAYTALLEEDKRWRAKRDELVTRRKEAEAQGHTETVKKMDAALAKNDAARDARATEIREQFSKDDVKKAQTRLANLREKMKAKEAAEREAAKGERVADKAKSAAEREAEQARKSAEKAAASAGEKLPRQPKHGVEGGELAKEKRGAMTAEQYEHQIAALKKDTDERMASVRKAYQADLAKLKEKLAGNHEELAVQQEKLAATYTEKEQKVRRHFATSKQMLDERMGLTDAAEGKKGGKPFDPSKIERPGEHKGQGHDRAKARGEAKGHDKDKAKGEAKGHDKDKKYKKKKGDEDDN